NREVPPHRKRGGDVGEPWVPPRERAGGERRSRPDANSWRLRGRGEVFVGGEPAKRLGLDLAHALAREAELLADRLERGRTVADETEAERDHIALAVRQLGDRAAHRVVAERCVRLVLRRRTGRGEEVAERRVAVGADRRVR